AGIPHLHHGIEIALLGGDQRAAAIHFDAAAFEHELLSLAPGVEQALAEMFGRGDGQAAVLAPIRILRPCVEMKVDDGGLCLFAGPPSYEDRPAVASPSAVRRVQNELDAARVGARALQI